MSILFVAQSPANWMMNTNTKIKIVETKITSFWFLVNPVKYAKFPKRFTRNQNDVILVSTILILVFVFIIQFAGDWATNKIDKR